MARQELKGQVLEVKESILTCTRCSLSDDEVPVPFRGSSVSKIVVLGESPDPTATQIMNELMSAAGFGSDFALVNVVSCPVDGAPPKESQAACKIHLDAQLSLINPQYIILAGALPLQQFKTNVKINKMHGRAFLINDKQLGYSIYNPMFVWRKGGVESSTGTSVLNELIRFRSTFYGKTPSESVKYFGDTCVINDDSCYRDGEEAWASVIEKDGTPWCETHWKKA